jgi:hypothetical protein
MGSKEQDCKSKLLEKVSELDLEEWLKKNPPPSSLWGKYSWAFLEMTIGVGVINN